MKRSLLGLCLLSPLLLTAGKNKFTLPHGKTIEVGEKLVSMVDTEKAPHSPVQPTNLGFFETEQPITDTDEANNLPNLESVEVNDIPRRPLSPADKSKDWRADQRPVPIITYRFGIQKFDVAKSRADLSQNWRRDQGRKLAVIGSAMCLYDGKKPNR